MAKEAVSVAKKKHGAGDDLITLSSGVEARIHPVTSALIEEAISLVEIPQPPKWYNADKDREEENPHDPTYLMKLEDAKRKQGVATIDTIIMLGVELIDGLPEDDKWIKQLKALDKMGRIDLSVYDLDDEFDREFVYKRYIAVSNDDILKVTNRSGLNEEGVDKASGKFPDNGQG